ncbi:putative leader peptide [Pseudonocardia benzenivorans]|uniref:Leader peptide n=1 Tax=Pseudonocardia benzenivorans TaxID=228005 RepID=A0ABW3VEK0_9PSEU
MADRPASARTARCVAAGAVMLTRRRAVDLGRTSTATCRRHTA